MQTAVHASRKTVWGRLSPTGALAVAPWSATARRRRPVIVFAIARRSPEACDRALDEPHYQRLRACDRSDWKPRRLGILDERVVDRQPRTGAGTLHPAAARLVDDQRALIELELVAIVRGPPQLAGFDARSLVGFGQLEPNLPRSCRRRWARELDHVIAEIELVAGGEPAIARQLAAVDPRTVRGAAVLDEHAIGPDDQVAVHARHVALRDADLVLGRAADRDDAGVDHLGRAS